MVFLKKPLLQPQEVSLSAVSVYAHIFLSVGMQRTSYRQNLVPQCLSSNQLLIQISGTPWVPYNGHCFQLYRNAQSWSGAQQTCRKDGGDLASIRNMEDHSFITTESSKLWIGLSANDQGTGYVWSDGSPVNFQHWQDGEPNNKNNVESCVEFYSRDWDESGSWNDNQCEARNGFVCQIRTGKTWLWHTVM
uniref:C-type lectin domain-containing protein n=1 Tax=Poecilia latipinna TaxID=48699 RepID=A0A3B3TWJ3_9TELE